MDDDTLGLPEAMIHGGKTAMVRCVGVVPAREIFSPEGLFRPDTR